MTQMCDITCDITGTVTQGSRSLTMGFGKLESWWYWAHGTSIWWYLNLSIVHPSADKVPVIQLVHTSLYWGFFVWQSETVTILYVHAMYALATLSWFWVLRALAMARVRALEDWARAHRKENFPTGPSPILPSPGNCPGPGNHRVPLLPSSGILTTRTG